MGILSFIWWVIVLIIKIDILMVVLTCLVGVYELRNDSELSEKVGWLDVAFGLLSEIFASLFNLFVFPLGYFRIEKWFRAYVDEGVVDAPVLLLHPYFGNPTNVWFLLFRFRKSGFNNVFTISLRPRLAGLDQFLQQVDDKVTQILERTGASKIALVGHSMGGLLARMYALENPDRVFAVVTVGAPHRGSKLAVFGLGRCARDMEPGSSIIQEIEGKYPDVPFLSVYSPVDNLALPQRTAIVPEDGLRVNYEAPCVGHLAMMFTPSVADAIVGFVRSKAQPGE